MTADEPTDAERLALRRLQLEAQRLRARGRYLLKSYREQLERPAGLGSRRPEKA